MNGKANKIIITIIVFSIFIILVSVGFNFFKQDFKIKEYEDEIEIQYGEKYIENYGNICYGNNYSCKKVDVSSEGIVDSKKIDKYEITHTYQYKSKKITKKQIVSVVDKTAPEIVINNTNINVCPNGKYEKLNYIATDNVDGNLTDKITSKLENKLLKLTVTDSSGNSTTKEIEVEPKDSISPNIKINGDKTIYITVGDEYNDKGATVTDNCDDSINIKTKNNVDTNKEGKYIVEYSATDSSGNISVITRTVNVYKKAKRKPEENVKNGAKIVYLTFDDGPSEYTSKLLDVLKKYNVKATFFVTGRGSDNIIKREYDEGHTVALHTYTHDYSKVYRSIDSYFDDLYKIQNRVKNITGHTSTIIRFPGGSSNTVSRNYDGKTHIMSKLTKIVEEKGFYYFDWNVSSGDASPKNLSSKTIYNNVVKSLKSNYSVVLQHDVKKNSVDAIEKIIQYGLKNGYTFEKLTETSPGVHHGVNN